MWKKEVLEKEENSSKSAASSAAGEFLGTVAAQIRCRRAREPICEELAQHIRDQQETFAGEGLSEEDALKKAVLDMGDPVAIGVSLDKIHRPKVSVSMLLFGGIMGIFSILLYTVLSQYSLEAEMGTYYMERQIFYIVAGYVLMLVVYYMDYSFLAGRSRFIAGGLLAFVIVGTSLGGVQVHGVYQSIRIFGGLHVSVWSLLFLYVPLFGALLYDYRGMGYGVLWRLFLWAALPLIICWSVLASVPTAGILAGCLALLFTIAIVKGWYRVSVKRVLLPFWSLFLMTPVILIGTVLWGDDASLLTYRMMRLKAWLDPDERACHYVAVRAKEILQNSSFWGRNVDNLSLAVNEFPGFQDDYILVTLVAAYGMLAGFLAVALLFLLVGKIFHISFTQKNQLGMIMGCACGVVFSSQILLSVGVNMGWLPVFSNTLPFFCYGGSSVILFYVLLGVVMSVHRYQEIPMTTTLKKVKFL